MSSWNSSSNTECKENDWLYNSSNIQWTITPDASNALGVTDVNSDGSLDYMNAKNSYMVIPALYLKSDVKIVDGQGTKSNPYKLAL